MGDRARGDRRLAAIVLDGEQRQSLVAVRSIGRAVPVGAFSSHAFAPALSSRFSAVTDEMNVYLTDMIDQRRAMPKDDLLTRLVEAEVDGERLTQPEILGFFQLLVVGGQETTTNLINNAILCFIELPDQLARIRAARGLLPSGIEEVLR